MPLPNKKITIRSNLYEKAQFRSRFTMDLDFPPSIAHYAKNLFPKDLYNVRHSLFAYTLFLIAIQHNKVALKYYQNQKNVDALRQQAYQWIERYQSEHPHQQNEAKDFLKILSISAQVPRHFRAIDILIAGCLILNEEKYLSTSFSYFTDLKKSSEASVVRTIQQIILTTANIFNSIAGQSFGDAYAIREKTHDNSLSGLEIQFGLKTSLYPTLGKDPRSILANTEEKKSSTVIVSSLLPTTDIPTTSSSPKLSSAIFTESLNLPVPSAPAYSILYEEKLIMTEVANLEANTAPKDILSSFTPMPNPPFDAIAIPERVKILSQIKAFPETFETENKNENISMTVSDQTKILTHIKYDISDETFETGDDDINIEEENKKNATRYKVLQRRLYYSFYDHVDNSSISHPKSLAFFTHKVAPASSAQTWATETKKPHTISSRAEVISEITRLKEDKLLSSSQYPRLETNISELAAAEETESTKIINAMRQKEFFEAQTFFSQKYISPLAAKNAAPKLGATIHY
jgi:hypothetical protein